MQAELNSAQAALDRSPPSPRKFHHLCGGSGAAEANISVTESINGPTGRSYPRRCLDHRADCELSAVMDEFIAAYSAMGPPSRSLTYQRQLTQNLQLAAVSSQAISAVADYDAHVLTIQSAQSAVDDKQGEVDAAGLVSRSARCWDATASRVVCIVLSRTRATVVRCR